MKNFFSFELKNEILLRFAIPQGLCLDFSSVFLVRLLRLSFAEKKSRCTLLEIFFVQFTISSLLRSEASRNANKKRKSQGIGSTNIAEILFKNGVIAALYLIGTQ